MTTAAVPFVGGDRVKLRAGVTRVRRPAGLLLVPPDGAPVIVSPLVEEIWDPLTEGVDVAALVETLRARRPRAGDVEAKLAVFLNRLWTSGLLEGTTGATGAPRAQALAFVRRRRELRFSIDPIARGGARLVRLVPRPLLAVVLAAAALAAATGLVLLLASAAHPRLRELTTHASVAGVAFIAFVLIPLHELGHAVACRHAGVAVTAAGIRFGRLGIPRPFVDTSLAWSIERGARRVWIPACGPLVDLLAAGAAAWILLASGSAGTLGAIAWLVALYGLIAVDVGTSPLTDGDGSHLVEALLDDDLARRAALFRVRSRFVRPRSVRVYRAACAAHVVATIALFSLLR